jgi:hypothetical protein
MLRFESDMARFSSGNNTGFENHIINLHIDPKKPICTQENFPRTENFPKISF